MLRAHIPTPTPAPFYPGAQARIDANKLLQRNETPNDRKIREGHDRALAMQIERQHQTRAFR